MYGEAYINKYKPLLKEFFDDGKRNSSKKMNAAMMKTELRKRFPNVFSIPGETEIKKYISLLFAKSKNEPHSAIDNDDVESYHDDEPLKIPKAFNWVTAVKKLLENNPKLKPKEVYNQLLSELSEDKKAQWPDDKTVKRQISQTKQSIRKKLMRSMI